MDVERVSPSKSVSAQEEKDGRKRGKKGGNIYLEHLPHRLPCQFQVLWNENKEPDGIEEKLDKKKKTIQSILFAEKIETR